MDRKTGEWMYARCSANTCGYCLPRNVSERAMAVAYAMPERWIRFSLVGEDHQTRRARMYRLLYGIKQAGYRTEWCWYVEPNPKGTGHHIHVHQHGDYLPQRELVDLADGVGFGRNTWIRPWRADTRSQHAYAMKDAAGYGMKDAASRDERAAVYLEVNGGRLHHHSRGFFRHPDGTHIGNVKAAVKAARGARRTSEADWVLVRDAEGALCS